MSVSNDVSLFNSHEIWGMTIATIYFIIGFPSNLLSIVVCCRSLFQNIFLKIRKNRKRKLEKKDFKSSLICSRKYSCNDHPQDINTFGTKHEQKDNLLYRSFENIEKNKEQSPTYKLKNFKSNELTRNASMSNLNERQIKLYSRNSSKNPHCKSFELYLVQISFCDVIIISYNLIEWTLLLLSRLNMIDQIYAEPVLISKFMCLFIIALNRTVILIHNWLVAFMAITRCYAIYKPLNSNTYFSSKFYFKLNIYVLISLLIIFTSFNVYGVSFLSYTKSLITNSNSSNISASNYVIECKVPQEIYSKYKYFDVYINITLGIIGYSLPCFITLIINLLLIYNIRNLNSCYRGSDASRRSIDRFSTTNQFFSTRNKNQFFKATSSLLTLSFSYLICNIPYSFLFLLMSLNIVTMNGDVIFFVTCLRYLNHCLNFYIYFITGKRFRNDVLKLLRLK